LFRTTLTPSLYHGFHKRPPFFEGWYYKMVSANEQHKVAIIPGVILGQNEHAFIQALDGVEGTTAYHTFPIQDFRAGEDHFTIEIGKNSFNSSHLSVAVEGPEGQLTGEIRLGSLNPWPVSLISPGIMGWFAWVPRMECYHGVLSFDHSLDGELTFNGKTMDFRGGHGYIEKDWGQSFPSAWVWFQSNHFKGRSVCITASVAMIPWIGQAFRGFIVGLWLEGKLYRFATYTGARIESLEIVDDHVAWVLRDKRYRLSLTTRRVQGGLLRGPTRLDMGQRVLETLSATVQVKLETLKGELLFEGVGVHTGFEVMGDLPRLLRG
jgi:tocopherol cyclase